MRGKIYSDQKCELCGSTFKHDENRRGLYCPNHPTQTATARFRVGFGKDHFKRFRSFPEAERHLDGVRFEWQHNKYDPRDYRADNPLGFANLGEKWLQIKEQEVKYGTFKGLRNYIGKASACWANRNIKTIHYGDIEDFLLAQQVSAKTRHNIRSCLNQFFTWLEKREDGNFTPPTMPDVRFELGWRTIIDKTTQAEIIREVKRISYDYNPKIWLGIRWLSIYVAMRPGEMIGLKEREVNVNGFLVIPSPKEKKPKLVALLPEDIEFLATMPKGFPEQRYFRHTVVKGHKQNSPFGNGMLLRWWRKACDNLGVSGVDLYGGTRHSSVTALSQHFTKDQIKEHGTGHDTSKAFERYMQAEVKPSLDIYQVAADGLEKESKRVRIR